MRALVNIHGTSGLANGSLQCQRDVFGELALLSDQPRSATVKCLEACTFLIVDKDSFNKVIRADLLRMSYEAMHFFQMHVPGFQVIEPLPPVHPSYHFKKRTFKKGHCFLAEGAATEETIWAIQVGEVKLTRKDWMRGKEKDTMGAGEVFCSMSAVPLLAAEPFTVTVTSPTCEVFVLNSSFFCEMQESVLSELRKHLRQDIMKRVKSLCIKSATGRDAMQSPRAEGFPDWREAPATAPRTAIANRGPSPVSTPASPKAGAALEDRPASPASPTSPTSRNSYLGSDVFMT